METIKLEAKLRTETKKGPAKRYRREGFIPSVLYGQGNNINLLIDNKTFKKIVPNLTRSTVISLELDNKQKYDVLLKDYLKNYVREEFIHLDFYELSKDKPVNISVQLHLTGNPIGVRDGGVLVKHVVDLEVECLPKDIVSYFEVNIEHLNINQTFYVRDLKLDEKKYRVRTHADEVIAHISGASSEEEGAGAKTTAAATAAPEAKTAEKTPPAKE